MNSEKAPEVVKGEARGEEASRRKRGKIKEVNLGLRSENGGAKE